MCQNEEGLFVLNEVQALIAVEGELGVIGDERDAVADGLRNNQVVAGVIVLLYLIDLQSGILLVMLLVEVEDFYVILFFYRLNHVRRSFPPTPDVWFALPKENKFTQ